MSWTRNVSSLRAACAAGILCAYLTAAAAHAQAPPANTTAPTVATTLTSAPGRASTSQPAASAEGGPESAWLKYGVRRGLFVLIVASLLTGIWLAHRGKVLPSRDIPGLLALEEAVARATEMGRPTLFTVGGGTDLKRVQLYASMPLLRAVARMSGELDNRLLVPTCYPETMPVHINAIRDGYGDAHALESFRADDVRFFPGGLFFFAMGAMGWMLEERPAACFYFGYWVADSLMFSETGQTIQAMQIAGTDQLPQVPFFVVSCDYTIIGEEFWAASAKLSGDPQLQGCLGAQDLFKLAVLLLLVVGCVTCTWPWFAEWMTNVRTWLR